MRTKTDVRRPFQIYGFTPEMPRFAGYDDNYRAAAFLPEQAKSSTARKPGLYRIAAAVEFAQVQPHTV
jgi:hypothetical protein